MIMIDILKNIESLRKDKHLSQEAIAKELGVSQSAYSNYVNRNDDIPFSRLLRIADVLKVDVIDIIKYPNHYVLDSGECEHCLHKEKVISQLSNYIEVLEGSSLIHVIKES